MIRRALERARDRGELGLIPYLTAGFPDLDTSMEHVEAMAASGVDVIEIGVPFSDPVADGPTIQHSSHVALQGGVTLEGILAALTTLDCDVPLLLMTYLNPLLAMGGPTSLAQLAAAGVSGVLIPDLPLEESPEWLVQADGQGVSLVPLIAPTSNEERVAAIARKARGFVYYVSVAGVTGTRRALPAGLADGVASVRRHTDLPVAVGFGISGPDHVRALHGIADAAVVGSALVDSIRRGKDPIELVQELKRAAAQPQAGTFAEE